MSLRRLRFLWLALAVAVLNAGVPLLGQAAMAGQAGAGRLRHREPVGKLYALPLGGACVD